MTDKITNAQPVQVNQSKDQNTDQSLVQYPEFTQNLVLAIYGVPLEDFKEDKKLQIAQQCTDIYQEFMVGYFRENYNETDYFRLQQAKTQPDLFIKFPELTQKFVTAYDAFLQELKENNTNINK